MRSCFVPGCDKKQKSKPKRSMFIVPKDPGMFGKWMEVLPKLRPLKNSDRVCHLHFLPNEIQKSFEHMINGDIYVLDRDRIRLKAYAVPSLNLPSAEDLLSMRQITRTRKQPNKWSEVGSEKCAKKQLEQRKKNDSRIQIISEEIIQSSTEYQLNDSVAEIDVVYSISEQQQQPELPDSYNENFNNLYDDIFEVNLPNTLWGVHRCPQRSVIMFVYIDALKLSATKMLILEKTGELKVILASRLMNTSRNAQTTESLSELLAALDELKICPGVNSSPECEVEIRTSEIQLEQTEVKLCSSCLLMS